MKRFANSNWLLAIGCAVGVFIAGVSIAVGLALFGAKGLPRIIIIAPDDAAFAIP